MFPSFREYVEMRDADLFEGKRDRQQIFIRTSSGSQSPEDIWADYDQGKPPTVLPPDFKVGKRQANRIFNNLPGLRNVGDGRLQPKRNLGIPRPQMPQIPDRDHFIQWLRSENVGVSRQMVNPMKLIRTAKQKKVAHAQDTVFMQKALKFIQRNTVLKKLVIVTRDGKIFDGNHHHAAMMFVMEYKRRLGDKGAYKMKFPMYVVDMDFEPLKQLTISKYPDVQFEPDPAGV